VKKPKLDRHYGQCRSSFTCIDCSATFAGPVQWKVHTSCITEAEKYQKSVYKGTKKGQGPRPSNGHQGNTQLKTMNATVEPSSSGENAAIKTERGEGKKRDSEKHTPNGMEPKEKKRKKKPDPTREHDGKDAPPDETTHVASDQTEASKVKGSSDDSQSKPQPPTGGIPETSGDKKIKKRRKEKGEKSRLNQGDVSKETIMPQEPVASYVDDSAKDEKRVKKRKHKEKREDDVEANHGGTAEAATKPEPLASQTDDAKGERKKKKSKEEKASGEKRKHEDTVANDVERKRRKRKQE